MEHAGEVQERRFASGGCRLHGDEVCASHDVVQAAEAHVCQIFSHFACQEAEVVHHIFIVSAEVLAQLRVLGGDTDGAGVGVAFSHHDAAQNNQCRGAESKLLGAEQSH